MSEEEVNLAHDSYVESNGINVNDLPKNLADKYIKIDEMIDAYEEDENEDKTTEAIETASEGLKNEIEAWHKAQQSVPSATATATASANAPTSTPQPVTTPVASDDEETNDWDYNSLMK